MTNRHPLPDNPPGPPVTFVTTGGNKTSCSVCRRATGYPDQRWQDTHLRGHLPCASGCGQMLTVKLDGTARAHGRWPCPTPDEDDADA